MKKRQYKSLLILLLFIPGFLFTQTQEDRDAPKRDVFVVLDVSGSMQGEKFTNVQNYLDSEVIGNLLKDGDNFTLVTFGDSAEEQFTRSITSGADRALLKADLSKLEPDNNQTDIGMALEKLAEILERREEAGVRRVILFITDGENRPSRQSKYWGADISQDPRFKALGDRVSRGSWFLYVIGIGGKTAAGDIAGLIPGSELQTTDAGLDINAVSKLNQLEEEEARLRAEAEAEARRQEALNAGFMGFLRRLAASWGIPVPVLIGLAVVLLLLLILLALLVRAVFKTKEFVITDEQETIIRRISPLGGITLNSPAVILPGIGNENNQILRLQRSLLGVTVQTLDSQALADTSPYKKAGTHNLKGVIGLANGRVVRITLR
ncbi:hypothetical protein AGMMS50230_00780 [Spirochaetia bacterium]|nr:hypothetical protein AGMMS50230_00780 [Spirochaetia bacterium]